MRMTKIVVTLGPSTDDPAVLREVILAGANVARMNFSHGSHEEHKARLEKFLAVRDELGLPVALLADTRGPEVRVGVFPNGPITLKEGQRFTLTTLPTDGDENRASVSYDGLARDVVRGTHILIDDGLIDLEVESTSDTDIVCTVKNGGPVSSRKGVNVPSVRLGLPFISSRDRADLRFISENPYDYIAASFTQSASDIQAIREELHRLGVKNMKIIAKIENAEGVTNRHTILEVSDGIMVARGDMGVEIATEEIPVIQKQLIKDAYTTGKTVITATQMLDSMMKNPRPTRAEATDVANAIYDGTSAIMLSGETAAGRYPVESVKTMARIAERAERDIDYRKRFKSRDDTAEQTITNAISHATVTTAHDLHAAGILTVTTSGVTAYHIAKYRPACPILVCTPDTKVLHQLNLGWGMAPLLMDEARDTDELFQGAVAAATKAGYLSEGDLVVITAGVPLGVSGTTNLLKVHVVGDAI